MRTVGEILREKREERHLSLEKVEGETKIRRPYLEALEKNRFTVITGSTTVKGFIRNYAQFLGLAPETLLAIFRRDFAENEKGQILPRGMVSPLDRNQFYWTPKLTVWAALFLAVGGLVFFLLRQYLVLNAPPPLEISSPQDNQIFQERVLVKGKTDRDASVRVDGLTISLEEDGSFQEEIMLPRGENALTIESANRQGKKRLITVKVKVE